MRSGRSGTVAAEAARDGPPVGPVLPAVDGVEFVRRHGGIGRLDLARVGGAEVDAAAGEGALAAPLPPADGQEVLGGVPADVVFGQEQRCG